MNPKPIFDQVRDMLGRGFTQAEVTALDQAIARAVNDDGRGRALANPAALFAVLTGISRLNQQQVDSVNLLLKAGAHWPTSWMAYGLATAWHECRFLPIREMGGDAYLSQYDTGALAKVLGNTPQADGDGIRYAGRGYVQLTGRTNYTNAGKALGLDLIGNPDLALVPANAARILIWGMEGGKFTGKALRDYLPNATGTLQQFTNARQIVNSTDKAAVFAATAMKIQAGLIAGGWV